MKKSFLPLLPALLAVLVIVGFPSPAKAYYDHDAIVNGGFELSPNGYGWEDPANTIGYSIPHTGDKSSFLNPGSYQREYIRQVVNILPGATTNFDFYYSLNTDWNCSPGRCGFGAQPTGLFRARVQDAVSGFDYFLEEERPLASTSWRHVTADLSSAAGRTVIVSFEVSNFYLSHPYISPDYPTRAYIDDVHIAVTNAPDITAPTTTVVTSPTAPNGTNGWFQSVPTVSLTALDGVGGSGVADTAFDIDGANLQQYIGPFTLPPGIHTINFASWDAEGNFEDPKTFTVKVDLEPPTASISYSTTTLTNQDVVATLTPSEPITVTNNGGTLTRTFSQNGSFTFTFMDVAGNAGSSTATVSNIDKTPPTIPAPNPAPPTPVVTPPIPIPRVLGAATFHPIMKNLKLTKGIYSYKLNGKTINIRPFGTDYKGTVWARSIDFGPDGKIYIFINSGAYKKGQIKVFKADGKLLKAYNPYGGFATSGLNATALVAANDQVYIAVGTTKAGTTVKTYQVTAKGLKALNSLTASTKPGNILVGFQRVYSSGYGLATMRKSYPSTLKVWRLDTKTNKFVEDRKINKAKIRI